jgi:hypothetical protein
MALAKSSRFAIALLILMIVGVIGICFAAAWFTPSDQPGGNQICVGGTWDGNKCDFGDED